MKKSSLAWLRLQTKRDVILRCGSPDAVAVSDCARLSGLTIVSPRPHSRPAFQHAQLLKKQDWLRLQGLEDVSTKHAIASALTAQMAYEIGNHSGLTKHSTNSLSWSSFLEIYLETIQKIYRKMG